MTAADRPAGHDGRALVVGPLAMPGFLLVLIGFRRHRRVFVLAGAVLLGLAIKLVDRPRGSDGSGTGADEAGAPAPETEGSPAQEPPTSSEPPLPPRPSVPPRPPKQRSPSPPPEPAAESDPVAPEAEPDQPEPA